MGPDRYRTCVRRWLGASPDLTEAYEWGWAQYREIMAQMTAEAAKVLPGATPRDAMRHLDSHGQVIDGVDAIRKWLQDLMDTAMDQLDGTHFELADPVRVAQAMIAPPGSAAAPYYTAPSQDFSRPGRTWLPTMGHTTFPVWGLYSTWYHEGVPGHHLQLAQWTYLASRLSTYQTAVGSVSACAEGWALYAERLMDELGYLEPPGARMGYLDAQLMRAIRVIIDIGMHLGLTLPADSPMFAAETWTPGSRAGLLRRARRPGPGVPGQRGRSLPRAARPGHQLQTGGAGVAGGPGGGQGGARRGVRPEVLAHGGAVARLARPGRPHRRTRPAVTAG